jgi:hypothetical protein
MNPPDIMPFYLPASEIVSGLEVPFHVLRRGVHEGAKLRKSPTPRSAARTHASTSFLTIRGIDGDRNGVAIGRKLQPTEPPIRLAQKDAAEIMQVLRAARSATSLEGCGRTDDNEGFGGRQPHCSHVHLVEVSEANAGIAPFLDDIDHPRVAQNPMSYVFAIKTREPRTRNLPHDIRQLKNPRIPT